MLISTLCTVIRIEAPGLALRVKAKFGACSAARIPGFLLVFDAHSFLLSWCSEGIFVLFCFVSSYPELYYLTLSGNLVNVFKIDKIVSWAKYNPPRHEHADFLENAVPEMESSCLLTREALAACSTAAPCPCAIVLPVWHFPPRLEKNETIFIPLSLDREQGVSYICMMGGAWKKTEKNNGLITWSLNDSKQSMK